MESVLKKVKKIIDGNLNVTFGSSSVSELHELENLLDEWVANYQEILLFTAAKVIDVKKEINHLNIGPEQHHGFNRIQSHLNELEDVIKKIGLYNIRYDGDSIMGGKKDDKLKERFLEEAK